ncbi:unnamed protein product [Closterium sp. NIES-53]
MALRPSTAPQRVHLPSPPKSSLPALADPGSDSLRAASPTVTRFLATVVTDPSFESTAASALVAELVHFAAHCRLDYAASLVAESESICPPSVAGECALSTDVLEDRQEEFQRFAAALPHLVSTLLAPEGDPDAPYIPTPRSYAEAIEGPYSPQWQAAMDAEMASWVKRPPGSPPVFKARYVARRFSQRQGVEYFQTFSPTPKMTTLRVLLHVAAQHDYELHTLDFSTAFLQGSLHEEIWLCRSPGFTGSFPPGTQWSLRWPVYGLRQAPREWHDTLRTTLAALGFAPSTADPSLFFRSDTLLPPFYIIVYVDDLVFATADTAGIAHVKSELQKRHTCTDLGELRSYLGLQITRDRARRTITLTQSHMVQQVLQHFDFTYSSPQATPLSTRHSLSALPSDESVEPSGPYPELDGCLMYLMTCRRPDLANHFSILARYVAPGRHRPEHMAAAKRVLRYLCSTSVLGLVLGGRRPVVLTGHADASWADNQATQRSSQGYTFSLGSGSVSWRSTRSSSVLGPSCEAEIYAGAMAAQELCWLTYLFIDLGEPPRSPPVLYVDNKAMLALCRVHKLEHRTKHIALCYFLARELQQRGQLRLAYVASEANTANIFTKALQPCDHQRFCTMLACFALLCMTGLVTPSSPPLCLWGQNVAIFDLDFDAILAAMYALTDSADGDCESAAPGAGESALSGTALTEALHTFTLDSGASCSLFRDSTTLTPLSRRVAVSLADPSGGPILAHSSMVLPCPAAPSSLLSRLHLSSFSTNLVSGADLQVAWVDQFTPGGQHVTCSRTGRHLATFTRRPGSSLYTVTTAPPPVSASGQVAASCQVFAAASRSNPVCAPCSCRHLTHETLLWHHRLGHPSLPRLRGMASRTLVSGLPRCLSSLPPGPAPTYVPCVEGWQRAAPHSSSFPPTEGPLQTLDMDMWGPARVRGQGHERYFLLVVDDYSRYTTVFPLRNKGDVTEAFCCAEGIRQKFTLPASPQQNGIAERRIGMVMDVARTSVIHAVAPHFLWPFAVQYAAHKINLQPRVSLSETTPTLRWMGKVGDASAFRVWGSRAYVRDTSADKLSSRAVPCVFLGFPPDAPAWQFYHPTSRRVKGAVDSGAARGAEPVGAGPGGAEPGGAEPERVEPGGAEPERVVPGGAVSGGAKSGGSPGVAGAGPAGGTAGAGAAGGAARAGVAGGTAGAEAAGATGPGGARTGGTRAAEAGGTAGIGATGNEAGGAAGDVTGDPGAEGTGAVSANSGGAALAAAPVQSQSQLQPSSPLPGPSPYSGSTRGLTDRREPASRPVSPVSRAVSRVRTARAGGVLRPRPPPVPGTHFTTLRPSTTPQRVPLPSPPASSLPDGPDSESDSLRAASPTVMCFLATAVTDPLFESSSASAVVAELVDFAAAYRLDYATSLVAVSVSASVCPPSVGGTYVDEVPPPGANIVSGMWIFRGKRPSGSLPVFKARYRDYEPHSLDFSTAFLQGSLHEEIWLCRSPGFTGSFPAGTQWSLRRPVYGLRQAPREWHDTLKTTLAALGFAPSTADPSLFLRTDTTLPPFYVLVYVDDLVFATADTETLAHVKSELQKRHTCTDLGPSVLWLHVLLATVHSSAYRFLFACAQTAW